MSIIYKLESLVHHRYTFEELKERLKHFDKTFEIYKNDIMYKEFDIDYMLDIGCDRGAGTIYYLPTRKGNFYITEVGFQEGI
jgi:hypothetical protein